MVLWPKLTEAVLIHQKHHNKLLETGFLTQQDFISHSPERSKPWSRALTHVVPVRVLQGLQMAAAFSEVPTRLLLGGSTRNMRTTSLSSYWGTLSLTGLGPHLMISFSVNYFQKALSPNTVTVRVTLQHTESCGTLFGPEQESSSHFNVEAATFPSARVQSAMFYFLLCSVLNLRPQSLTSLQECRNHQWRKFAF